MADRRMLATTLQLCQTGLVDDIAFVARMVLAEHEQRLADALRIDPELVVLFKVLGADAALAHDNPLQVLGKRGNLQEKEGVVSRDVSDVALVGQAAASDRMELHEDVDLGDQHQFDLAERAEIGEPFFAHERVDGRS
jgi:hypothetical protein